MLKPTTDTQLDQWERDWPHSDARRRSFVLGLLLADVRASHANERYMRTCVDTRDRLAIQNAHRIAELEAVILRLTPTMAEQKSMGGG